MPSAPSVFRRQLHSPFTATVYTGPPVGFPKSSWETFGLDEGQRTPHGDLVCWREGEHAWLELRGSKGRVPGTYLLRAELSDETLDEHSRVYEWAFDLQDTYSVCTPFDDNTPDQTLLHTVAGYRERGGPLDVTGVERDLTTWQALLAAHPASYADDEAAELDLRARSYILGCVERAKNLERSERDRFLQAALGQETRALTRALGDRRRQRT